MKECFPIRNTIEEFCRQDSENSPMSVEAVVNEIISDVRENGEAGLRQWSTKLDGQSPDEDIFLDRAKLCLSLASLPAADRRILKSTADRIRAFAEAQRECLSDLNMVIPGGRAGHRVEPIENAGCYVPGGRYPLPSSVLMTVIPARVAGVKSVWIASPNPNPTILSAAAIAGADGVLLAGGAQAIAALAFGVGAVPASDIIVGPGNQYVTAAKKMLAGDIAIDMLAGPSELVIVADFSADPALIAADLLAQAEHDPDARAILIAVDGLNVPGVLNELGDQLQRLQTEDIAKQALGNGGVLQVSGLVDAAALCDELAPEHLQLCLSDPETIRPLLRHYGALFIGAASAEVFGDYGAGPNHVLPTGGKARSSGGLSVFTFLRQQTWMELDSQSDSYDGLCQESLAIAKMEGLEAHAISIEQRVI